MDLLVFAKLIVFACNIVVKSKQDSWLRSLSLMVKRYIGLADCSNFFTDQGNHTGAKMTCLIEWLLKHWVGWEKWIFYVSILLDIVGYMFRDNLFSLISNRWISLCKRWPISQEYKGVKWNKDYQQIIVYYVRFLVNIT